MTPLDIFKQEFLNIPRDKLLINVQNSICVTDLRRKEDLIVSIIGNRNHLLDEIDMNIYKELVYNQIQESVYDIQHPEETDVPFVGIGFKYQMNDYSTIYHFIYESGDDPREGSLYMFGVMKRYGHFMNMVYINKDKF